MRTTLRLASGRHGLTVLVGLLAGAALVEDLVSPTVTVQGDVVARAPAALVVVVLTGVVIVTFVREWLGVMAPLAAVGLLGLAAVSAPAWVLNSAFVFLLVMLLCGMAGYLALSWLDRSGVVFLWVVGTLAIWRDPGDGISGWILTVGYMSIAWAVGALIRRPVAWARSAEQHAADLEGQHQEAARRAVEDERQRIARELHDIIAHSMSVMTLQAGAVRRRLTPSQAVEHDSLEAVELTGREAMAEVRRLVGLWKEEEGPHYAPQSGMATLEALLAGVRSAGVPVDLVVDGTPQALAPGVDLTAYRVVQEALTNVIKHAGPARATVRIGWQEDELHLEVVDDGRTVPTGIGFGHAGMRERLRIYGGQLDSGPLPEGGYRVYARLPIGPEA